MNISFNQRIQSTEEKIQKALFSLLRIRRYDEIAIKELCYEAGINRSSFYAHYTDINDLMLKTEQNLSKEMAKIFNPQTVWNEEVFVKMFEFLLANKDFYNAYLQTNAQTFMEANDFKQYLVMVNRQHIADKFKDSEKVYHMAFFAGGLKAISKAWLMNGCKQTPAEMAKIITDEYKINSTFFS